MTKRPGRRAATVKVSGVWETRRPGPVSSGVAFATRNRVQCGLRQTGSRYGGGALRSRSASDLDAKSDGASESATYCTALLLREWRGVSRGGTAAQKKGGHFF